ncbi:MAG: trigger factor [Flavobacteriaceae bacterium]|nr:trigger factor [Flavobacteriaceae bacterium]
MDISKQQIDDLNAVVTVAISKADYSEKVEGILKDYRKKANIPGFRPGRVPMGLVKKQYGKAVLVDEVNKLLQVSLSNYLVEEKLDVLGNPIPVEKEDFNWDQEDFSFAFELGLAPKFDIKLKSKKAITRYKIVADDKMVNEQVERIQKQYGKLIPQDTVAEDFEITGTFKNEEEGIENKTTLSLDKIKGKRNKDKFLGTKVGDSIPLKSKKLFAEDHDLMTYLKVEHDKVNDLDIDLQFDIEEINKRELAPLDQEFFDKLFGEGNVTSEEELKNKIKEDSEKNFEQQSDQKLLNDITESLLDNTKFELPETFLKKWIRLGGENPMTEEEATAEYEKSEKGWRYQLIEGKIIEDNNLQAQFEELKEFAKGFVHQQIVQFGQMQTSDEELDIIADRVMSNKEEVKRLSEQLMSQKLLTFYKENANLKTKEITYENFIKEVYS